MIAPQRVSWVTYRVFTFVRKSLRGCENSRSADSLHQHRVITSAAKAGKVWITRPNSRGERTISPGCTGTPHLPRLHVQEGSQSLSTTLHVRTCGETMKSSVVVYFGFKQLKSRRFMKLKKFFNAFGYRSRFKQKLLPVLLIG